MRILAVILFSVLLASSAKGAQDPQLLVGEIKAKLKESLISLKEDITYSNNQVNNLKLEKIKIENNLKNMEAWGLEQEELKNAAYKDRDKALDSLSEAKTSLQEAQDNEQLAKDNYHRVKKVMCYLGGAALLMLYLSLGANLVYQISLIAGAWGPLLRLGGPLIAFGLGYLGIYLYF